MSRGTSRTRGRMVGMRRWDGRSRITTDWFGYHNDPELNFPDGDLLIFLHEPGSPRKRTSFRLHAEFLATTGFQSLVDQSVPAPVPTHWALPARPHGQPSLTVHELYLPASAAAGKGEMARQHLATRNFFAWLYDRPLTGKTLGASLVDLMTRAYQYRPNDEEANQKDMLAYLDRRGYMDFRECVDHALAALHLAESFQMEGLWVNAFAHSVGMNHALHASIEYDAISRVTRAMITRARLEMDIRLDRVANSLTTFFDNDLSGSYLGLTHATRDHMERFRSFLHAYYIESHGFWPPAGFESSFALRRSLCRSMYVEFRALYQYLVDTRSTPLLKPKKSMMGGISILQNVQAFDERYRLEHLPHPFPLLPDTLDRGLALGFTIRKRRMEKEARNAALLKSFNDASNRDADLVKSRLVRKYYQFEKDTITEDVDPINLTEGRKVRWILIYAIFQILASVISAPKEVKDTDGLSYPLCCQRPKTLPWMIDLGSQSVATSSAPASLRSRGGIGRGINNPRQLKPDVGYLKLQGNSSSTSLITASSIADSRSTSSVTSSPASTLTSKSSGPRSLLRFLQKGRMSSTGTATTKNASVTAKTNSAPFHEIYVYGYGNGLNETINDTPKPSARFHENSHLTHQTPATTNINNSAFIKTTTSRPTKNLPSDHALRHPLSITTQNLTKPRPQSTNLPLPDSPTVPKPQTNTTPSTSRDSSANSTSSRFTLSGTSTATSSSESQLIDQRSTKSIDNDTLTSNSNSTSTSTITPTRTPTPVSTPKSRETRDVTSIPKPKRSTSSNTTTSTTTNTTFSTITTTTILSSPPKRPTPFPTRPSLSVLTPTSSSTTIAGRDTYLSLPSDTGSGRMGVPRSFMRSYSNGNSNSNNSSSVSVNVIREEGEVD